MKFRLVVSALLVTLLGVLAVLTDDSSAPSAPAQASTPSSDDAAMKSLKFN